MEDEVQTCDASNYKVCKVSINDLQYFPLVLKLKRLFMSKKTSSDMRWYGEGYTKDEVIRHLVDLKARRSFDELHPISVLDIHNFRLVLTCHGHNFRTLSAPYSARLVL